jgi:hypothetical protein
MMLFTIKLFRKYMFFLPGQNFFDIENLFFSSDFIIFLLLLFCIQFGEKLVFFFERTQSPQDYLVYLLVANKYQNGSNSPGQCYRD